MSPLTAQQFLFGAGVGCWNLQHRWDELKQRMKKSQILADQFYELDDCFNDTVLRLLRMYGTELFPGPSPHFYGSFVDAQTKRIEAISDDPLDFVLRIATNRSSALRRKRWRELSRHVVADYSGPPSYHNVDSAELEEQEKLREFVAEFHATPSGQPCRDLHRLHYHEQLSFGEILKSHGEQLGLKCEGSLRARALRCRKRLEAFILVNYPSIAFS